MKKNQEEMSEMTSEVVTTTTVVTTPQESQSEIIGNDDYLDDEQVIDDDDYSDDEEIIDDEENEEFSDDETENPPTKPTEPKAEELTPFATICKEYLEKESLTDTTLATFLVKDIHAYNLCALWIENIVKEGITHKTGTQIGFISDADAYLKMKEFFVDNVYTLKINEEKEKKEKEKKAEEERAKKATEKKQAEEKRLAEQKEKEKREEEWKKFLETGNSSLSVTEIEKEKYKHLKQQDLFEF